ncbi:MAG: M61 family metallopeptidase [Acidobacteria bacterium]|nr:M61 family metallopeptidase [Acidobacteriota bacterium]
MLRSGLLLFMSGLAAHAADPTITISVDATEAPRRIFHARLVFPAAPGPLTLQYPKWIPGEHSPTGPIADLAGLKITASVRPVAWKRDDVDMYAFHLEVPVGASAVEVALDFLSPPSAEGFSSAASATAQMTVLSWNTLLLYPEGKSSNGLTYKADLRVPAGWKYGTALPIAKESGDTIEFAPASLTTLVDSPVIAGRYFRTVDLSPGAAPAHYLHIGADSAAAAEISPLLVAAYRQLVAETGPLFGTRHYRSYHFLLSLSDHVAHFGLEHHESSDNRVPERTLIEDNLRKLNASLLPHEFTHSWNGKYRRPRGLATADYQEPMRGELLWVYEGLTNYLGDILAPRSGILTPEEFREALAIRAASLDLRSGRAWRPLADTAVAAQILYPARKDWADWRRSVDYYSEGTLLWLEADVLIRTRSQGRRSLDDFCRRFHGGQTGSPEVKPYTFDDIVAELNTVEPFDWRGFLNTRLNSTGSPAPLGGIEGSGWRLVYNDVALALIKAQEEEEKTIDLSYSMGLQLKEDGTITDVVRGLAADRAGVPPATQLMAVNGRRLSREFVRAAIRAAKTTSEPLELLVKNGEYYTAYRLDYHQGEKYPHLERDPARPDLLREIIRPRALPVQ